MQQGVVGQQLRCTGAVTVADDVRHEKIWLFHVRGFMVVAQPGAEQRRVVLWACKDLLSGR